VEIHERIRSIRRRAFEECNSLTEFNLQPVVTIEPSAFAYCRSLTDIEFGGKLETIGDAAFIHCTSLRRIKIPVVTTIARKAFSFRRNLTDVELGSGLVTIGSHAFDGCAALKRNRLSSVTAIEFCAFRNCKHLTEFDAPVELRTIGDSAFAGCSRLVRIGIPLNDQMIQPSYNAFSRCERLSTVELVGDNVQEAISLLGLKKWQREINEDIGRINQILPRTRALQKTMEMQQWLVSVQFKIDHYKREHNESLKEILSLLELILWKIKRDEIEKITHEAAAAKRAKIDCQSGGNKPETIIPSTHDMRAQCHSSCSANVVIENVLPFLYKFEDVRYKKFMIVATIC